MKKILLALVLVVALNAQAKFYDVDVTHPYFHSIEVLQSEGVVEGHIVNEHRMFFPLSKINRAEALKLILLSTEIEVVESNGQIFPDVEAGQWFADFVNTAYQLGVVEGFPDGNFYPAITVRRAEFIKMLFEALKLPVPEKTEDEMWFDPYLILAEEFRLLPADKDPNGVIDRGEAAEIIFRTQQVNKNEFTQKYRFAGSGLASFYNEGFAGRPTASGELYDPTDLTAAHRTLPFGTRLKVMNEAGDFVVVRINDRGPYHQQRVLDLSQAAFERLAPVGTGVLPVTFELFSEPDDLVKSIPEAIRPLLAEETKQAEVPTEVVKQLRINSPESTTTSFAKKNDTTTVKAFPEKSVMYDQPLFGQTTSLVAHTFYPDIELRRTFAQTQPQGMVFELAGKSLKKDRFKEVTVFMENKVSGEQTQFTGPMSGNNFVLPIAFMETGVFEMGIVFDNQRQSRVAEIEVKSYPRERKFPASEVSFASPLNINVVPEDDKVWFDWASGENRLTKLVFSQNGKKQNVVFEGGMTRFAFDYAWFDKTFMVDQPIAIDLYQALSADGTLFAQRTNWKKVTFKNFDLIRGFPDSETEALSIKSFTRFYRAPQVISLEGKKSDSNYELFKSVFITQPEGTVTKVPLVKLGNTFNFTFEAKKFGRYVVEVISTKGDILFNRGVFVSADPVLPVMANKQTVVKQNSYMAIYDWINRIRGNQQVGTLLSSVELQKVAQNYAERMANENFIGHEAPDGSTPADRLEGLNLRSFAENVSYGTNLNLALSGLENSGSHRQNIISNRWSRMGVGLAQNQKGEFYVVQIFAS